MVKPAGRNTKPLLGITIGDPAGIGPEIALKALRRTEVLEKSIPVVYSDRIVLEDAIKITGLDFNLNPVNEPEQAKGYPGIIDYIEAGVIVKSDDYSYGAAGVKSAEAAFQYIIKAINDAMAKKIDAVVTCPISKEAIDLAGHHFAGHTEIFAHYTNTKKYGSFASSSIGIYSSRRQPETHIERFYHSFQKWRNTTFARLHVPYKNRKCVPFR